VLAGATPFGDTVIRAVAGRLGRQRGRVHDCCRVLDSAQDLAAGLGPALSAALHVQSAAPQGAPPLVLLACAAAELGGTDGLGAVAAAARREFRRSRLAGEVGLCVYAGPVAQRLPADDTLRALEGFPCDFTLVATDTDGAGRRLHEADAVAAAGLFLSYLVTSDRLQGLVSPPPGPGTDRARSFAFGIARLDLGEDRARRVLCEALRERVFERFFGDGPAAPAAPPPGGPLAPHRLAGLRLGGQGALGILEASLALAVDDSARELLQARAREVAEDTRRALEALLPVRVEPRPGWWARLVAWLRRLLARVRRITAPPPAPPGGPRPAGRPGTAVAADLVEAEKWRFRIAKIRRALRPEGETPGMAPLFETVLADLPEVRARLVGRCLPDVEETAWQLARDLPLPEVLAGGQDLGAVMARLDAACARALRLDQRPRLIRLDDYRPLLPGIAAAARPLFPGTGSGARRLALVPADLRETFDAGDCEAVTGGDGEVVCCLVQAGVSLVDLLCEGDDDGGIGERRAPQAG
jgi:hypothetical protein